MTSESEQSRSSFEENSSFHGEDQCTAAGMLEANDVCEELLGSKMSALELNDASGNSMLQQQQRQQGSFCDGSDSGVDIATTVNVSLQRALSNNSGGYASSTCGGLDESVMGFNGNMSCDSSMISYSSDLCELKAAVAQQHGHNTVLTLVHSGANYECCSENGSESSSVTGGGGGGCGQSPGGNRKLMGGVKKKVAMFEPNARTAREKEPNMSTGPSSTAAGQLSGSSRIRSRLSGITRTASLTRHSTGGTPMLQPRDRARSREKSAAPSANSIKPTTPTPATAPAFRATQLRTKPQKPDSLPSTLTTHAAPSLVQRNLVQRTPSLSRARTPGTPSDDGRWPSLGGHRGANGGLGAQTKRGLSATPDLASMKMRSSMLSMDVKSTTSNPYGTMPRRRKQKSVEDLTGRSSRSSSTSRDPLSNPRMVSSVIMSSRKNLANSYGTTTPTSHVSSKMLPPNSMSSLSASKTSLARKQPALPKTKIYHETSAQTAITSGDLEKILSGAAPLTVAVDAAEFRDKQTQSDIRDKEMERLHTEIRRLAERENSLASQLAERAQRVTHLEHQLKQEREEKLAMQRELHLNTERVMGMLELARVSGTPTDDDGQCDSLLMLESQIQMSGHELIEKQEEIGKLRKLCRTLQAEMERSLVVQESLLHEKVAIEQESNELHDFLQHEKAAMCDALKEMEQEYQACKRLLDNKDEEIKVLRDECRHLVRLNEQRRQENRLMQSKYTALENKSKDLLMQQNASVSGASMSLSGLHSRLDSLVEQLVSSYSISEQDLEDIVFQNEALTNGNNSVYEGGSCEYENQASAATTSNGVISHYAQTSDGSLSPQRNQSFIAAVISAIRHATTPSGKKLLSRSKKPTHEHTTNGEESDSTTEMLDSETEPCLMMDNVLEDVTMPDSHSHNMVSSSCTGMISQIEVPSELLNAGGGDESLQNLSQAITNRQQMELQINSLSVHKVSLQFNSPRDNSISEDVSFHDSVAEMPSLAEYGSAQTVVDQVIEVDNIVTKLLKVLRLIQMDNDNCIQQLILDKNKLQQNKEDMLEKLKDLQDVNIKLQDELMDATQELMLKNNDLSSTKAEMQRHRNEIDRLTEDICNLSTLCSNYKKLSPTTEFQPDLNSDLLASPTDNVDNAGILNLLKMWHQEGQFKEARVRRYLLGVLNATAKECNANTMDSSSSSSSNECRRIYENQLENVLKTLHDLHSSNLQHPSLQQLQQDIEDFKARMSWLGVNVKTSFANANDNTTSTTTVDNINANGVPNNSIATQ